MNLRRRLRTAVKWVFGILLSAQMAVTVALIGTDAFRKRGRALTPFPVTKPEVVDTDDNTVEIYTYGEDLYADMLEAIGSAREFVYFETFIWKDDPVGRRFRRALIRAARRGVRVYVVYDVFANMVVNPKFFKLPDIVNVRRHPLIASPAFWNLRNSGRDHRKVLVVDGRVGFLGGYNIGELYATGWRDTHARFTGPVVADIGNSFIDYWNSRPVPLRRRPRPTPELFSPPRETWAGDIRIHRNTPRLAVYPIRNVYLEAIDRAQRNIWMTQAYFIPDEDLRAALISRAQRGVDVRIIVPAESNHVVADWLSRGFYDELLSGGVRLFLYEDSMVHAKTATIDGQWSTIGTANLDNLSLLGNYEINAEIINEDVAKAMEEIFENDLTNCRELELEEWQQRSIIAKFTEALLSPWRPLF